MKHTHHTPAETSGETRECERFGGGEHTCACVHTSFAHWCHTPMIHDGGIIFLNPHLWSHTRTGRTRKTWARFRGFLLVFAEQQNVHVRDQEFPLITRKLFQSNAWQDRNRIAQHGTVSSIILLSRINPSCYSLKQKKSFTHTRARTHTWSQVQDREQQGEWFLELVSSRDQTGG